LYERRIKRYENEKGRASDPSHVYFATCNPPNLDIRGGSSVNAASAYTHSIGKTFDYVKL